MINDLVGLGYGIVVFGILIGVGSVVLGNLGNSIGGTANTNVQSVLTQLGSSGLSGWLPAIIAISIGLLFLGAFLIGRGNRRR